jgi:hypothetical protein
VFSKTEWVRRILVLKELYSVLDYPADVIRAATRDIQETWSRTLTVPIKVRSEILEMVESFLEGTAPVKRDREQPLTASKMLERKKVRRDLDHTNTSASSQANVTSPPTTSVSKPRFSSVDSLPENDSALIEAVRADRTAKASKADDA